MKNMRSRKKLFKGRHFGSGAKFGSRALSCRWFAAGGRCSLSASGNAAGPRQVILIKSLSQIQRPDAPLNYEKSGLAIEKVTLRAQNPMVLVLSRGGFCPKDRRQAEGLVQLHRELEVGLPSRYDQHRQSDRNQ
jgi:hypothetical protein